MGRVESGPLFQNVKNAVRSSVDDWAITIVAVVTGIEIVDWWLCNKYIG